MPGPGAYDILSKTLGPSFSLIGKYKEKLIDDIPGPGAYDQADSLSKSPTFKMSKAARSK
jgi:hypothetical protein